MCCCQKPTKNGEPGYNWNNPSGPTGVYPVSAPAVPERATLVYDEPGRCSPMVGGSVYRVDHHSHHYRVVKDDIGRYRAFVRHGGGLEEFGNSHDWARLVLFMASMDSDARFVFLMSIESTARNAARAASDKASDYWRAAAQEKRIKTRKARGSTLVKVWIVPRQEAAR